MFEIPYCFAFLFAERTKRNDDGRWDLEGVFDLLVVESFPADANLAIFIGLTDGRGEMPVRLSLVDVDDLFASDDEPESVGTVEGTILLPDPVSAVQATVSLPAQFDHPGVDQLELRVNEERLQTRRLAVVLSGERVD